jgi:DNA-3-methyladenine glycosylase II
MDKIIAKLVKKDPNLKKIFANNPVLPKTRATGDIYFDLVRTIAYQQLHGAAAAKIFSRFIDLFESGYPSPQIVAVMEVEDLKAVGYSRQKANYIRNIATFALDNDFEQRDWDNMSDEEIIKMLTEIKGVGIWTVQMLLIFSLNRPDVFPTGDYGIQMAIKRLYQLDEEKSALLHKMNELAEAWIPHRSMVSRYLWLWGDDKK